MNISQSFSKEFYGYEQEDMQLTLGYFRAEHFVNVKFVFYCLFIEYFFEFFIFTHLCDSN